MTRSYRVWYLLALLVALAPAGARLVWQERSPALIAVDPAMAAAGQVLFSHEWKANDPLCEGGDGLGPVYNDVSCVACHNSPKPGGAGGVKNNVTNFTVSIPGQPERVGVIHAMNARGEQETLWHVHHSLPKMRPSEMTLAQLNAINFPEGVGVSQRNTPALFGANLIDQIPERVILANARDRRHGRVHRLADGRIGRFGWKAQMASLSDFVKAACANELGLGNPGQSQPAAMFDGARERTASIDLTIKQCDELTAFCASLPRPVERISEEASASDVANGKKLFRRMGCAECHTPKLGSVDGIYSDLLLHSMGDQLVGGGSYGDDQQRKEPTPPGQEGPSPDEWRTPPLWGVADSAPYMHDGRAATLEEAIKLHGGHGASAAQNFANAGEKKQRQLIAFLKTLRAP